MFFRRFSIPAPAPSQNQYGTFKGVFVPSILTILGVILFLRLGWVVGQAGLLATLLIITLSSLITFITGLSISASATNTDVGPGGSYFLVSRCFGVETGAAIGIPLYCAQALGVTFYAIGFAESLGLFFPGLPVQYVAFGALLLLTVLTFISSDLALKTQVLIFVLILLALLSFFFGQPLSEAMDLLAEAPIETFGFWMVFAVFFPAVTGIEAGVSLSGDLKDPGRSLPIGTLSAVAVGYVVYLAAAVKLNQVASPAALIENSMIMTEVAVFGILVFVGLWGATLSSTLGALLGAPRTLQALAKDRVLPKFLAQVSGEKNEPKVATVFTFLVAAAGLLLGDLNAIAAILSMFFLTSYGALNLVAGLEGLVGNPTWRPKFRVHWSVSIFGAFLCFGAMIMINPGAFILASLLIILTYMITQRRAIRPRFSDIRSGLWLYFSRQSIFQLDTMTKSARNWRPNFLIFSGSPKSRLYLIEWANAISRQRGFLTIASILTDISLDYKKLREMERSTRDYLRKKKVSSLVKVHAAESVAEGCIDLIKTHGIGPLVPNTIVMGDSQVEEKYRDYAKIICAAHRWEKNTVVIKMSEALQEEVETQKLREKIDIWWRGRQGNASLMLTIAYMMKSSIAWRNSQLTIKSIADSEDEKEGIQQHLVELVKSCHIPAKIEVEVKEGEESAYVTICRSSRKADLVFMGLRAPWQEEAVPEHESFANYYKNLMEKTTTLPNVIYTLAGEDIEFHQIFSK